MMAEILITQKVEPSMNPRRNLPLPLLLLPLLILAPALPLYAQDEMVTDRPDQSESTAVVGRHVFQLETGVDFSRDESPAGNQEDLALGGSLLRWGFSDRLEFRFAFTAYSRSTFETADFESRASGLYDPELGFKVRLRDGDGYSPALAILASTTLPVGDDELTSDEFDPTVRLAADHELSDTMGLGWNVGYSRESDGEGGEEGYAIYSASLGVDVDDTWGVYYELFGHIALDEDDDNHSFDTGITYMASDNFQIDLYAGVGINGEAPDTFIGLGVSWRSN
jgi:hypothetical protein